jgi:hypothetical protein
MDAGKEEFRKTIESLRHTNCTGEAVACGA